MIIAIDFDGTIAEHAGDGIGPELVGAIETIKLIQRRHSTILWTCRGGEWLQEAVDWLQERSIIFDKVNENIHALTSRGEDYWPRKVFAHMYIDDKVPGGFPGWNIIRELLEKEGVL